MVNVKHKTLDEVRTTIRNEIRQELNILERVKQSQFMNVEKAKSQATIDAYRNTLAWLADLGAAS